MVPLYVFADETKNSDTINEVSTLSQCEEFKEMSDLYFKKAKCDNLLSEKFKLIAINYQKMYKQCVSNIKQKTSYSGYRINAVQQKIIDEEHEKPLY